MAKRQALIVAGLFNGDEGKGSTVDYVTRRCGAHTIVRYNGGSQAAHYVSAPDGRTHCFSQFGSGTLLPGVRTYLSRHMLVDPITLMNEFAALRNIGAADALERLTIDRECLITTPFHVIMNRMREVARGAGRHGSCGMAIGETVEDARIADAAALFAGDLADPVTLRAKLSCVRERMTAEAEMLVQGRSETDLLRYRKRMHDPELLEWTMERYQPFIAGVAMGDESAFRLVLEREGTIVFEGAQGVLLDAARGFLPHVTWTDTTFANAEQILTRLGFDGEVKTLGLTRAYGTRHGAGPFVTEDPALHSRIPACSNGTNEWQGSFRLGWLDLVALRYAITVAGKPTALGITNVDRLDGIETLRVATAYRYTGKTPSLHSFFEIQDGLITGIKMPGPDPTRRMELTRLLTECVPVYDELPGWKRSGKTRQEFSAEAYDYARWIAKVLGVPLGMVSLGPTASEKLYTNALRECAGHFSTVCMNLGITR